MQLLEQEILRFYEVQVLSLVHALVSWCYEITSHLENNKQVWQEF